MVVPEGRAALALQSNNIDKDEASCEHECKVDEVSQWEDRRVESVAVMENSCKRIRV